MMTTSCYQLIRSSSYKQATEVNIPTIQAF